MSLFQGQYALKHQFKKLIPADFAGVTSKATAKLWIQFVNNSTISFLDNTLVDVSGDPVSVSIVAMHPDSLMSDIDARLDWIEIPGLRVLNYSTGLSQTAFFEAGSRLMVYIPSGTPVAGSLNIAAWT